MSYCILDHFGKADIIMKPFPHVIIENLLPQEKYESLVKGFPPAKDKRFLGFGPNARVNCSTKQMVNGPSKAWKEFALANTNDHFWNKFVEIFQDAVMEVHPEIENMYDKKLKDLFKFGEKSSSLIRLDAYAGFNTPVSSRHPTRVRGPHVDNPAALYGGLLYMRKPSDDSTGGEFIIYETKDGFPLRRKEREVNDKWCTEVSRVPYAPNTLALFINGPKSVHGVSKRYPTKYTRRFGVCITRGKSLFKL